MIRTGDVIMVRGTSLLSRAIMHVLSRGRRACLHSHDAVAVESETGEIHVLSAEPPRIRYEPIDVYFKRLHGAGAVWCVARPREIFEAELDGDAALRDRIDAKRIWMSRTARNAFAGTPYPVSDLWVIGKRLAKIEKWLPFIKEDKAHFYCTESVAELWRSNHGIRLLLQWRPREWEEQKMPAPIHTEYIAEGGGFHLVLESVPGFFHAIVNAGAWPMQTSGRVVALRAGT